MIPIKIERDIPIPDPVRLSWPFASLKPGETFEVSPGNEERARLSASAYKRHHPGWGYISRKMPNGNTRFWRTA